MSPEPSQEPVDQNLKADTNLSLHRTEHESDSEDENFESAGYLPLSQVPTDVDTLLDDDEDDEWIFTPMEPQSMFPVTEEQAQEPLSETIQVWSSQCNKSSIDLDANKINQVKSMMASFTLPTTAIPEWATAVKEDEWKDQLINKIKEIQERE